MATLQDTQLVFLLMQDTKGAVGKLEMIFALLTHAIFGLAYLAIFNVSSLMSYLGTLLHMPMMAQESGPKEVIETSCMLTSSMPYAC